MINDSRFMIHGHCAILKNRRGNTLTIALVFVGIFMILTTAVLSYVQLEIKVSKRSIADAQAFAAAEAGIEYYRWHLAHAPDDFMDGTGETREYTHEYRDPQGGRIGTFTLAIEPRNVCDGSVRIIARGVSDSDPSRTRTVAIQFGAPALTKYAFVTNANIWFAGGGELKGPVHGNNGIRMDAEHKSRVTSAKETYICGQEHLCSPPTTKPGIWGSGSGGTKGLWDFPVEEINFNTLALDLRAIQQTAVAANTAFGPSNAFGYHAKLNTNATVDVFRVTAIAPKVWGYDGRTGWVEQTEKIASETLVRTITLPEATACGAGNVLFFEDALWVNGETKQPVTLVAGRFTADEASIIINGNLATPAAGQDGKQGTIGLIAQKDVLIPLESPDTLDIHAALFAQKGHVFRNYYCSDERLNRYGYKCNRNYNNFIIRSAANVKGTVITNQTSAWRWVDSQQRVISGYRGGDSTFETRLIFTPPPFFPRQGEDRVIRWEEVSQ